LQLTVVTGINKERTCHFDVASGPFKWPGGAFMWPCSTLKTSSWTLRTNKQAKKKQRVDKSLLNVVMC